jgi:hypothetical protein
MRPPLFRMQPPNLPQAAVQTPGRPLIAETARSGHPDIAPHKLLNKAGRGGQPADADGVFLARNRPDDKRIITLVGPHLPLSNVRPGNEYRPAPMEMQAFACKRQHQRRISDHAADTPNDNTQDKDRKSRHQHPRRGAGRTGQRQYDDVYPYDGQRQGEEPVQGGFAVFDLKRWKGHELSFIASKVRSRKRPLMAAAN